MDAGKIKDASIDCGRGQGIQVSNYVRKAQSSHGKKVELQL